MLFFSGKKSEDPEPVGSMHSMYTKHGGVHSTALRQENMNSALSRRDEGCQWVSKVLNRKESWGKLGLMP